MRSERQPSPEPAVDVTSLLQAWGAGDAIAGEQLLPVVYAELRRQAARAMGRESSGHTLQPTALVHETYLRLVDQRRVEWRNRAQFLGVAAQVMRRILVDHARARRAAKRGHGTPMLAHVDAAAPDAVVAAEQELDVLTVQAALERLAALDPDQARLVELRYFGGLTIDETAGVLGVSAATVKREWAVARCWLQRELGAA